VNTLHLSGAAAPALACALAPAHAATPPSWPAAVEQVVVTASPLAGPADVPTTTESVTADEIAAKINAVTTPDVLRYLPDVLIRERHFGDTQAPITTRTSGVGASARSLVYADGVLLSALIGNNNSNASPRWGLVSPDEIARVDVLYGPFAAYPGNSIGAVVEITTRTPDRLEGSLEAQGARQSFRKYGDDQSLGTGRLAATLGDRFGRFSFFAAYDHLDTHAHPLTYATAAVSKAPGSAGSVVTGAYSDASRTGAPIQVLGSTAIERQIEDNATLKLGYDLTPTVTASYTVGLFRNDDRATDDSYLRDAAGQTIYAGALNIGGHAYTVAPSAFDNGVYRFEEDLLAQGLTLGSHSGGAFDWRLVASRFDYLKSRQRIPSGALPAAFARGPGSTTSMDGTRWTTLDGSGTWRPFGAQGAHVIDFGAHADGFDLNNPRYALAEWTQGPAGATLALSRGRTETQAVWAQDIWRIAPRLTATVGLRWEHWDAYRGLNFSVVPAFNVAQPGQADWKLSPKAVLAFTPAAGWTLKGSVGQAYRFATVTELYQAVAVGPILASPNPNLRPEDAVSAELSAERAWSGGRVRLSLFGEDITDALISQTGQAVPGSGTPVNFVQNVPRVQTRGVELVASKDDVLVRGLQLSGWITYVDARVASDRALPTAVGKQLAQLPRLRASAVATWRPTPRMTLTAAGRYSDRSYGTIDNSDGYANTYQGFGAFFVVDLHARYQITSHLAGELGVDNLTDRSYFEFHPFPGRTVIGDLKYSF